MAATQRMWYIVMDVKNDYAVTTKEHICEAILLVSQQANGACLGLRLKGIMQRTNITIHETLQPRGN
jgi:hypothetical protein